MPVFARFLPKMQKETPFVLVDKRRFFYGGEDGIRTHVRFRANWFRVIEYKCKISEDSGFLTEVAGTEKTP